MLKILQARLQKYMNWELPDVKADLEKAEEVEVDVQKNIYFCYIDYTKAFDYVDHNKLENS